MSLNPIVEPASDHWSDLLDAYQRSAEVYKSEWEMLDNDDPRLEEVIQREQEFLNAAADLRDEHRIGLTHLGLVDESMNTSARTLYASEKRFGVSDIGGCRRYVQYLIDDEDFTDPRGEFLAAYVGTAVGTKLEEDYIRLRNPHARAQIDVAVPVEVVVDGEVFEVEIPGHPDIVEPLEHGNSVIDYKTKDGLGVVIREEGQLKHRFQITLYAKGLIRAGIIDDNARLALVYYDRSGSEEAPHTVEWTYDEAIYEQAVAWLSDVIYAKVHGEEAEKDMPRHWCQSFCPMFTICRGTDTDVTGIIRDPDQLAAIALYDEAHKREKAAKADKAAAAAELKHVAGHTPDGGSWRWVHVNDTKIEAHTRHGYDRVAWTPPKAAK